MLFLWQQIIQTLVTDIEPDGKVRVAMNEINAAVRQRAAALEKAEAGAEHLRSLSMNEHVIISMNEHVIKGNMLLSCITQSLQNVLLRG